jgi:hypothetical protein
MKVTIVNMIQPSLSGETNHDTEPNIAVNPANVQQIAGTAFSPDPMGGSQGPVYRSTDEGINWDESDFLPTGTVDQTLRFSGNSNRLFVSYLDPFIAPTPVSLHIVLKADLTVNGVAPEIANIPGSYPTNYFDQPYIQAYSVMGGSGVNSDRVYVGGNHHGLSQTPSAIYQSMDAGIASPVFTEKIIEARVVNRNAPQVRIAAHLDGTIYAVFYSETGSAGSSTIANVTIVRDDNWGSGTTPYTDLKDSDTVAGKRIVIGIQYITFYLVGNERTWGDISIACDPGNSSKVYVAWAELLSSVYTIHLVSSSDKGVNWSTDLLTITNATHPCLTVNSHGKIGFLYQQITGIGSSQRWETHFRSSDDGIAWDDLLLCSALVQPTGNFGLGDYTHIMAAGKNFYGIFPADNTPDLSNFPATAIVTYNRNHNFATKQLLANDGVTLVNSSVDPFFFKIEELAPDNDFYVRDWTNNAGDHDLGQEPSTQSWFFHTSDVWNSNTNTAGTIVDDWYQGDQPTSGTGPVGDNFAFARISRNDASSPNTVHIDFLSADYGLGIPYSIIGSQDINFAIGDLSKLTEGQPWHLDPTASTHVCLAAQIGTTGPDADPFIPPGLLGNVPGWPFPDLLVINDNNKAQRNLDVIPGLTGLSDISFMRVRNAATFTRDMHIRWDVQQIKGIAPKSRIEVIGGESKTFKSGDNIILKNMNPGENRWIAFSFESFIAKGQTKLPINFYEMNGNQAVNGCTILLQPSSTDQIIKSILQLQYSIFNRIINITNNKVVDEVVDLNLRLLKEKRFRESYVKQGSVFYKALSIACLELTSKEDTKVLNFDNELKTLSGNVSVKNLNKVLSAHNILLKKLDIYLTMRLLEQGDLACILSNVRMQFELYSRIPALQQLRSASKMLDGAKKYIEGYSQRKVTNNDYPKLIRASIDCFKETAKSIKNKKINLNQNILLISENMDSLRKLQKAHYNYLLQLSECYS